MADVVLRAGDTDPPLDVLLLEDDDATPVATNEASQILVRLLAADRTAIWENAGTPDASTPGRVTYQWQDGDTDDTSPGLGLEFRLTYPDGRKRTLPTRGPMSVAFVIPGPPDYLPIQPDEVAAEAGLGDLTPGRLARLARHIRSVAGDMESYLGYSPAATQYTETVIVPSAIGETTYDSQVNFPPVIQIISATPLAGGHVQLVYLGGYDVERTPALRSYLVSHAAARYRASLAPDDADRPVSSISVEGQSVSYAGPPGEGDPGAPPTLDSLSRYKRRGVFSRTRPADPFAAVPTGIELDRPLDIYNLPPGWYPADPL